MEKIFSLPCLYGTTFFYKNNCATSYVDERLNTKLESKRNKYSLIPHNYMFLRGIEYLIFSLYFLMFNLVKSKPIEYGMSRKVANSLNVSYKYTYLVISLLLSFIFMFVLLGFLPIKMSVILSNYSYNIWLKKFIVVLCKVAIIYTIFLILKLFAPFKQFYRFNACANSLISKNSNIYMPTNFLNYVIVSFLLATIVCSMIVLKINPILKILLNFALTMICFSICFEILYLLEKSNKKWLNNICVITSFLVVNKPTKTELIIAGSSFREVKFMQEKRREMLSSKNLKENEVEFCSVYNYVLQKLKYAGIDDESEADWLCCEVLGINRGTLKLITVITKDQKKKIENATKQRMDGEPITKIFGRTIFFGYTFKVNKEVLSPRMETEILVENVLKYAKDKMDILDIGTGSGAIAISLAKNVNANLTAVDISEKALEVAIYNAQQNKVKVNFKKSNLFDNLKKGVRFDIIVSNPPYIPTKDIELLDKEVKNYDPRLALDGGEDGLSFYKNIILASQKHLKKNGMLFFEIGINQTADIKKLLKENYVVEKVVKDYNKIDRVIIARLK